MVTSGSETVDVCCCSIGVEALPGAGGLEPCKVETGVEAAGVSWIEVVENVVPGVPAVVDGCPFGAIEVVEETWSCEVVGV